MGAKNNEKSKKEIARRFKGITEKK